MSKNMNNEESISEKAKRQIKEIMEREFENYEDWVEYYTDNPNIRFRQNFLRLSIEANTRWLEAEQLIVAVFNDSYQDELDFKDYVIHFKDELQLDEDEILFQHTFKQKKPRAMIQYKQVMEDRETILLEDFSMEMLCTIFSDALFAEYFCKALGDTAEPRDERWPHGEKKEIEWPNVLHAFYQDALRSADGELVAEQFRHYLDGDGGFEEKGYYNRAFSDFINQGELTEFSLQNVMMRRMIETNEWDKAITLTENYREGKFTVAASLPYNWEDSWMDYFVNPENFEAAYQWALRLGTRLKNGVEELILESEYVGKYAKNVLIPEIDNLKQRARDAIAHLEGNTCSWY